MVAGVNVLLGVGGMSRVTDSQRWEGTFGSIWSNPAQAGTLRQGAHIQVVLPPRRKTTTSLCNLCYC